MRIVVLFLAFFAFSCVTQKDETGNTLHGKVVAISDGDTFKLLTKDNEQLKIRLHGIDCPEKKQDYGQVAKQKLSDLIFGEQVTVVKKDTDRYGRTIAVIYTKTGECINEEMLKAGLAWHYKQNDNIYWAEIEKQAKDAEVGLWSKKDAVAPWTCRMKN